MDCGACNYWTGYCSVGSCLRNWSLPYCFYRQFKQCYGWCSNFSIIISDFSSNVLYTSLQRRQLLKQLYHRLNGMLMPIGLLSKDFQTFGDLVAEKSDKPLLKELMELSCLVYVCRGKKTVDEYLKSNQKLPEGYALKTRITERQNCSNSGFS